MKNLEQTIDALHMEDLRNETHPSIFDENEQYDMLILRLPTIENELQVNSMGLVITTEASYLYDKNANKFQEIGKRFEGPYTILDPIVDHLLKSFSKYQNAIADMEESLYLDKFSNDFMIDWLKLKRDVLRVERVLLRAEETMREMIAYYETQSEFPINRYIDIHEHIERIMRSALLQISKLDYIYNFYSARSNEKMNRLIYSLTIISAIFLPLNLLVGFFGMNTSSLPFTQGDNGTIKVIAVMLLLVLMTSLLFRKWRHRVEKL
jgi:magnesium transporter